MMYLSNLTVWRSKNICGGGISGVCALHTSLMAEACSVSPFSYHILISTLANTVRSIRNEKISDVLSMIIPDTLNIKPDIMDAVSVLQSSGGRQTENALSPE
jgi:hypothetical protein